MAARQFSKQNFVQRAGSGMPGRMRRAIDGNLESTQRNGETLEVAPDGRLEVKAAKGGGLKQTPQGLTVDQESLATSLPKINRISDPVSNATLATAVATLRTSYLELLSELRRKGYMRG